MTGRERFLNACRRRPVDATPVWFMRQAGRVLPEYRRLKERYAFLELARNPELIVEITLMPLKYLEVDAAIIFADIMLPWTAWVWSTPSTRVLAPCWPSLSAPWSRSRPCVPSTLTRTWPTCWRPSAGSGRSWGTNTPY